MSTVQMFKFYVNIKSFFYFIWLKLVLNEEAFQCIQSPINTSIVWESQAIHSITDTSSQCQF